MPRLVRQLAALLASGRNGPVLWAALAGVLATEQSASRQRPRANRFSDAPGRSPGPSSGAAGQLPRRPAPQGAAPPGEPPALAVIRAVERASALGLPTADAIRSAVRHGGSAAHGPGRRLSTAAGTAGRAAVWLELAACFEVCEASGAPVAAVLSRLADRLETEQDTAELRETALAGPRATVRLLTWLPFIGLGLGTAMGVDPLGVLLGGPVGWACLAAGLVLVVAGRWWSHRLISAAARTPSRRGSRAGPATVPSRLRRAAGQAAGGLADGRR
ncbi:MULTISPECIES: type II secretion system F family protein [unclassified Arthrobacter]|uniref:type II secretion system F family protein n=1 Tax=unclassified Arthrobacter TaxID=235627 RepID=UPI00159D5B7C|nr:MULTISPECIES: hypothetical protein [unclassified Arthrobacter]MCQ9165156.1 hypothetical protein [Arthrobacter sp. STN4]